MNVPTDQQRADLLADLQAVEKIIRADLLAQYRADERLMARARQRLADEENSPSDIEAWLQTFAGRGAVLYILKTLYVRVLEDQGLLQPTRIREGGSYELFQRLFPNLGVAAYLRRVFDDAARLLPELFSRAPIEIAAPSEASARSLWSVWQAAAPGGGLKFDFRGELDTRFIGDLYQDLDPDVKKRYALLQTPRFIEEFILDRTLDPALQKFGLDDLRIIDPTCGSGHFLVGAFARLNRAWRSRLGDGSEARWQAALNALTAVCGADLNEYACALSRFRLLLAVVSETEVKDVTRLRDLHFNVITCDSLLPWEQLGDTPLPGMSDVSWLARYGNDEERERNEAFFRRNFHAVVGNPPYIAVADKKKREDYRRAWPRSATGKYSLSAPMTERFILMPRPGGYAGLIVANNFCKRQFGRGIIERVLPGVSLDLVVDTSGAYVPGHGTPTVMLFVAREKVDISLHGVGVVAGKRGEPSEPADAAKGQVWSAIAEHWAQPGYEDAWIAVRREPQATFCLHPWTLGSDVVMRVKERLDAFPRIRDRSAEVGFAAIIAEDEAFIRRYARALPLRPVVSGEDVRDWHVNASGLRVLTPHSIEDGSTAQFAKAAGEDLWSLRTTLRNRGIYGTTFEGMGLRWWQYWRFVSRRLGASKVRIVISQIATNNHFVTDSSDALYGGTALVLTLRDADEANYRDVAAVLNSSIQEFWFKQVCFEKGGSGIGRGIQFEEWEKRYVRIGTNILEAPLPKLGADERITLATMIESQVSLRMELSPARVIERATPVQLNDALHEAQVASEKGFEMLIALQEEVDWRGYRDFGLVEQPPLLGLDRIAGLARGHRPFEIALARRVEKGEEETAWFDRHGLVPTTIVPERYEGDLRNVLERRLAVIESDEVVALLEQPVYKRRWQVEPWETQVQRAAESWLLDRLEGLLRAAVAMLTIDEFVERLGRDPKIVAVVGLAKLGAEVTLAETFGRLLESQAVPDNAARLLTAAALQKCVGRQTAYVGTPKAVPAAEPFAAGEAVDWKRVWRLQEREDAGEPIEIAVPPPFKPADYVHRNGWKLRGKFNVPNERFIAFDELYPVRYAWGGWPTAERAELSLEAFELRGREPDGAPMQPTEEAPQRCGIQFALWDKIDELRRTGDPRLEEVQTLAQMCGRACPCSVLDQWRSISPSRRNGRAQKPSAEVVPATRVARAEAEIDPVAAERLIDTLRPAGARGLSLGEIEPLFSGNREAARRLIEILRSDGRVEVVGKGRGTRYRLPQVRLL